MSEKGLYTCSKHSGKEIRGPKCPECSLEMVPRKGKFGGFWGCTAYPMCDGIKKF
ncbi:MAG: topoisomerase DNA-binding C4 zinc finger domain-containing protein [archaeon]